MLTTYADRVGPALEDAGHTALPIDMPAGPDHTSAYLLRPPEPRERHRTLYVEAVNEADEEIRPTFALTLTNAAGRLHAGACGSVHGRVGLRVAYLAVLTTARRAEQGTGTRLVADLFHVLKTEGIEVVHLGTQTAAGFHREIGFQVDHVLVLVRGVHVRVADGREIRNDLVMLSKTP